MQIRVTFTESGTGDCGTVDIDVEHVDAPSVVKALVKKINDINSGELSEDAIAANIKCLFFVEGNKGEYAFIAKHSDPYFGEVLWTGHVYEDFI